ncbi:MAG TPA: hypothetical protein VH186_21655 [Chloroflexia bacterium]|nr:hypothetical protein [Chloroflexia bacterium]
MPTSKVSRNSGKKGPGRLFLRLFFCALLAIPLFISFNSASAALPGGVTNTSTRAGVTAAVASVYYSLYDGTKGGTPDTQKFAYVTKPLLSASAVQTFANNVTTLDSTFAKGDSAGYFSNSPLVLDRTTGFRIRFGVQVVSEDHSGPNSDRNGDGKDDRAGFSIIAITSDKLGIELGFWTNRVWAQEGGAQQPPNGNLFTQAEGTTIDNSSKLSDYELHILGSNYFLFKDGVQVLTGPLRDYTASSNTIPYSTPNLIFLGDDTSSAMAKINLSYVSFLNDVAADSLTVTTTADSLNPSPTPVGLRQAIINAQTLGGGEITFALPLDPPGSNNTINLAGQLAIPANVRILGDCANRVLITGSVANPLQLAGSGTLKGLNVQSSLGPVLQISNGNNNLNNTIQCSSFKRV